MKLQRKGVFLLGILRKIETSNTDFLGHLEHFWGRIEP